MRFTCHRTVFSRCTMGSIAVCRPDPEAQFNYSLEREKVAISALENRGLKSQISRGCYPSIKKRPGLKKMKKTQHLRASIKNGLKAQRAPSTVGRLREKPAALKPSVPLPTACPCAFQTRAILPQLKWSSIGCAKMGKTRQNCDARSSKQKACGDSLRFVTNFGTIDHF